MVKVKHGQVFAARMDDAVFVDRKIKLIAKEVWDVINQELEVDLEPGDLGEHIITEGLGDLSDITPGTFLLIGDSIGLSLQVQEREHLEKIEGYHSGPSVCGAVLIAVVRRGLYYRIKPRDVITAA